MYRRIWMCFVAVLTAIAMVQGCSEDVVEPEDDVVVEIVDGPDGITNQTDAEFEFQCNRDEGCDYDCRLNDGDFERCDSPTLYEDLDDGAHVFTVFATDDYEEESEHEDWEWIIDTEEPEITDLSGPSGLTNETDAEISFDCSKDDCDFSFGLTGLESGPVEPSATTETTVQYEDLDDDEYTFSVQPTDLAGNMGGEATLDWAVDTIASEVSFPVGPGQETDKDSVSVEFECDQGECEFECALDFDDGGGVEAGEWEECVSPLELEGLAPGDYELHVVATDAAGNEAELSLEWTVVPAEWTPESYATSVSAGGWHACAVENNGNLWCWGWGSDGELGTGDSGTNARQESPTRVSGGGEWVHVSAGDSYSCGIQTDGTLWCWGSGDHGVLGLGDDEERLVPTQVGEDATWVSVSAGIYHTCGIRENGTLWCWGRGEDGALGQGDAEDHFEPVQVGDDDDWTSVSVSTESDLLSHGMHSCAVKEQGTLWCWGGAGSALGQGEGVPGGASEPLQVGEDEDWSEVDSGHRFNCAIKEEGSLWCWGWNGWEPMGEDADIHVFEPLQIGSESDWQSVNAGPDHVCGIRQDGTMWCWGRGEYGELGQGDQEDHDEPVQVGDASEWAAVSGGVWFTLGLRQDGTLWGWGRNHAAQLGVGDYNDRDEPEDL